MVLNLCQLAVKQDRDGLLDSNLRWVEEIAKNDYIQKYWNSEYRDVFTPEFEEVMDKYVNDSHPNVSLS
jgi:hypothetical protein